MELYYLMKSDPKKTWKRKVIITSKEAKNNPHSPSGVTMTEAQIPSTLTHTFSTLAMKKWKENGHIFQAISKTQKLQKYTDNEEIQADFPTKPNWNSPHWFL